MKIRTKQWFWLVPGAIVLAGCDIENPGPVPDEALDLPASMEPLMVGIASEAALGINNLVEYFPSLMGELNGAHYDEATMNYWAGGTRLLDSDLFDEVHSAIWVAENGLERMQTVMAGDFATSPLTAKAQLWAGFSNRLAGGIYCESVKDGGPRAARSVYFTDAEQHFTNAIATATAAGESTLLTAAYGGRASVRANLGDMTGAVADAAMVPDDFVYEALFDAGSTRERNQYWFASYSQNRIGVRHTWYEDYFTQTSDPRVPWQWSDPPTATSGDGIAIHVPQNKFPLRTDDIPVTKGWEMRLLEAEYQIVTLGDWAAGMTIINNVRAAVSVTPALAPWTATNQQEALEALLKERAIVLWLEHRRGEDLYRLNVAPENDPILQAFYALAPTYAAVQLAGRATCFPIGQLVINTNDNVN